MTASRTADARTVTPHRIEPHPSLAGYVLVHVVCPHCGREHVHGGRADDYAGHRAAACHARGGYVVRAAS